MGEYLPGAPASDEARQRNGNLPGQGGVFNLVNLHVYHYAGNNPVKYVDPDGRFQTESPLQKKNSDTNNERGYQVSVSNHSNATWFVDLITGWTSVLSKSELSRSESGIKNDDGNFSLSGGLADIEIFLLRNPENKGAIADKKAMEVYAAAFGGEIKDGILTAPKDHTYSQVRNRMGVIWGLVAYTIGHGGNQTALMEGVTLGDEWNNLSGEDKKIIVDMVNQFIKNGDLKLEH
jgi:hypothetical protein